MRHYIFISIAFLGMLVACGKEDYSKVSETSLMIEGRYDCISAEWFGLPVDLNNDGKKSCDIIGEFSGMENSMSALGNNVMTVTGVENAEQTGCMSIRFPMQYIRENNSDGKLSFANPLGSYAWYEFFFSIDKDGSIDWQEPMSIKNPDEHVNDEGHYHDGVDYLKTGSAHVRYIIDGTVCIIFNVTYYDWHSMSWVTGQIEGRYRRRSPLFYD